MLVGSSLPGSAGSEVEGTAYAWDRITISSPVEEIVADVMVEEGARVEEGQVLAQLAARKQELELQRLELLIEKARFTYEATEKLHREKIESKETLMEKKADLDQLLIDRELAEAAIAERRIAAPIAGTVVHRLKDPGESVSRVEPVFEIIDASRLKLQVLLPSDRVRSVKEGVNCAVSFPDLPDLEGQEGTVVFVDPQVDARSGLFRVRLEFDNKEAGIKPGVRVRVVLPDRGETEAVSKTDR